tara:strand:+ start:2613 stop:2762 length:150 start_codon:yes stop_codon:yes gene_type:complete
MGLDWTTEDTMFVPQGSAPVLAMPLLEKVNKSLGKPNIETYAAVMFPLA